MQHINCTHLVGNHTIAAVRGQENYEIFSEALKESFKEINKLHKKGTLKVDDVMYKVKIYYAADVAVHVTTHIVYTPYYKYVYLVFSQFMLLVLGSNAANSDYACIWYKIHKDQRLHIHV